MGKTNFGCGYLALQSVDIKQKIFIGKRNYAGLDIMNNVLLNDTNNDIYIYKLKTISVTNENKEFIGHVSLIKQHKIQWLK